MTLIVTENTVERIIAHSRAEQPIEACGYLVERDGVVCHHYELKNTDDSSSHFSMDPAQQFAVARECRNLGYKIRAVYHSHPETPARPSDEDIRLAYDPAISYVIISLAGPEPCLKSFMIKKGNVEPEPIKITKEKRKDQNGNTDSC